MFDQNVVETISLKSGQFPCFCYQIIWAANMIFGQNWSDVEDIDESHSHSGSDDSGTDEPPTKKRKGG